MNLWQQLEVRGRDNLKLGQSWKMYAVDLDKCGYGWAEVKFARKSEHDEYLTNDTVFGNIQYSDLEKRGRIL
ncbi:hypothetical protein BSK59_13645 [Paenibacillus odorifer]|uniref:hypothetical protein n=1 Tax=Paenibacillus odorifer TaxID=189426 RepID=UPI00096CEA9F|nr:hypothetical protein [Paenibacillus odorifer]OME55515.1 hypothetical protein BSK59_13645 [Paenibacillus odorifer]